VTAILQGVRILEVAEHTFVPAASALLSDWGAEVIKIEHVERGDAMRGLMSSGVGLVATDIHAAEILTDAFASATLDEWRERLASFTGQWAVVQTTLEAAVDPQTVANGYLQECHTAAGKPFRLVAAPVQFDEEPAVSTRAPDFNEHGDAILADLGLDWDTIVDLKVRGVVA
jgi:crotonobetainyl-CoA:carnitine CoA-transferase CaiB-like acyl-CoA transferase